MRPIQSLIDTKFLTKARLVNDLTSSIRSRLASNLRNHCWVSDIVGNSVIIITDQAEHGTLLRYQQHELVKQINEEFTLSLSVPVRRIKIKIDYKLTKLSDPASGDVVRQPRENAIGRENCRNLLKILNTSKPR